MYVTLHSFTYPLKPLTQASISIQPMSILHATHNNVLPYLDVSHLESFSAAISIWVSHTRNPLTAVFSIRVFYARSSSSPSFPSGCLTPRNHSLPPFSIRVSRTRNPSPPPFSIRGISHPESCPPMFHLLQMSHIRNSTQPTFHLLWVSHTRNPVRRRFTFPGCLTSGILSTRRSIFFFILRAFSLGSKVTFLIKLCRHFLSGKPFLHLLCF